MALPIKTPIPKIVKLKSPNSGIRAGSDRNTMSSLINWIRDVWESTELLYTYSYRLQVIAALLTLPIFFLTGLTAVLTNRKDRLDQAEGIRSAKAIANANERAAAANERAGQAEVKAAEANKAAARMDEQARRFEAAAQTAALETARIQGENLEIQRALERERMARLQIEAKLAPRTLSLQQQTRLKERLSQMRGLPLEFRYLQTHEPAAFATQLIEVATGAGLEFGRQVRLIPAPLKGVIVGTSPEMEPRARELANALVEAGVLGVQIELGANETVVSVNVLEKP